MKKFKDNYLLSLIVTTILTFTIEIIFRILNNFSILSYASLRILISCFLLSLVITSIASFCKRWIRNTIIAIYVLFYAIYTCLQVGFINYLGVYISLNTSSQLGAVTSLIGDFLQSFKIAYLCVFIPFIFLIVYFILTKKLEYKRQKFNIKNNLIYIVLILISAFIYTYTINVSFMQDKFQIKSNNELFLNPSIPTVAVNQFGTLVFGALDLKTYLYPIEEELNLIYANSNKENIESDREVPSILDELVKGEDNKKYDTLNKYFASQNITGYNDYTGMFEGKNVIVILMESVNDGIINEKYFPNFMKLYNEGWHFNNNYSPRNSCATGNNEFSAMTSLYSIYNTCTSNTYKKNTYFEAIFNLFNNKGYTTTSMHDYYDWYYARNTIHTNMGSGKYYNANALKIKASNTYGEWASDSEFMEKAMDILLSQDMDKPFMTWFTTVTPHTPYTVPSPYGDLYKEIFIKDNYNTAVSRYLSKVKVTDDALGIMLDRLEAAGILDDTLIVLLADHQPYSLGKGNVSTFLDYDLDDYEIDRTPLVIYNSKMVAKSFDMYTSYINLLPTLANLLNLDYDPRLYMGSDVLDDSYKSLVVFADGSWKNEIAYYNAAKSKIKYYGDETYTDEEIKEINNMVNNKIEISSLAIKNNYFNYLEEKYKEYNKDEDDEFILDYYKENNICPKEII